MKKHIYNESFFDAEMPDVAYVVGFWAADGYISKRGKSYTWGLVQKDREHLVKINEIMGNNKPLMKKGPTCWQIRCYNKIYYDRMSEMGYSSRKSNKMPIPELSKRMMRHFLRGYFDGDGSVMIKRTTLKVVFTCGDKEFLNFIKNYLIANVGTKGGSIFGISNENSDTSFKGSAHQLSYSTHDSLKLYDYFYKDDPLCLGRKKEIFESYELAPRSQLRKKYRVETPDNSVILVDNLRQFMIKYKISSSLKNVIDTDKSFRGYRISRV